MQKLTATGIEISSTLSHVAIQRLFNGSVRKAVTRSPEIGNIRSLFPTVLADLFSGLVPDDVGELLGPLEVALRQPARHRRAACRGLGTETFFVASDADLDPVRAICSGCPVRRECLDYALVHGAELVGIWSGTSAKQRRRMRRKVA